MPAKRKGECRLAEQNAHRASNSLVGQGTPLGRWSVFQIVLAIFSGILLALVWPRASMHWMAWFALVPVLSTLRERAFLHNFLMGAFMGVVWFGLCFYWVFHVVWFAPIPLVLYLCLYPALWAALLGTTPACTWLVLGPCLWVLLEYVQGVGPLAFPWLRIGSSQLGLLPGLLRSAGSLGGSWLVVSAAFAIYVVSERRCRPSRPVWLAWLVMTVVCLGCLVIGGRLRPQSCGTVDIGVVQGNFAQSLKWHVEPKIAIQRYIRLSNDLVPQEPETRDRPETAVPIILSREPYVVDYLSRWTRHHGIPLLVGSLDEEYGKPGELARLHNSAYVFTGTEQVPGQIEPGTETAKVLARIPHYAKRRLLPFGETVPFAYLLPFVRHVVETLGGGALAPGNRPGLFTVESIRIGVLICYESILPGAIHELISEGAEMLLVLSNDAWFGRSGAAEMHALCARARAVEYGRSVVRATNTGISCVIGPDGRITAKLPAWTAASACFEVKVYDCFTPYMIAGDWLVVVGLLLSGYVLFVTIGKPQLQCAENPGSVQRTLAAVSIT